MKTLEEDVEEDDNDEDTLNVPKVDYRLLFPQALVGLVDAVSFMIVGPSLIFYVYQAGGTKEQYGTILATFSFSSFLFKPVLGYWSDRSGGKFRAPYLTSIAISTLGSFLYFMASIFIESTAMPSISQDTAQVTPSTTTTSAAYYNTAIVLILIGRFLGGCGAANQTLGFTYMAQVTPPKLQTQVNSVLSVVRIFGMAVAPALNGLLTFIQYDDLITFPGSRTLSLDPLNSVGLFLVLFNGISFLIMYFLLEEPPEETKPEKSTGDDTDERGWIFWRNVFRLDIQVPILAIFTMNANFQLLETGMAPVANDLLGWEPVKISALFGFNAILIFLAIVLIFKLSSMGVQDVTIMKMGLVVSILGYVLMFSWWRRGASTFMFVFPVIVCTMVFPFLGSPTRSLYTVAVTSNEHLRDHKGTMFAILSMMASVAGFAAPSAIASYVLRTPDEVVLSRRQRELTPWALFAPILSLVTLLGVLLVQHFYLPEAEAKIEKELRESITEQQIDERLALLGSTMGVDPVYHPRTEANRRHSSMIMHIPDISFHERPIQRPSRHTAIF